MKKREKIIVDLFNKKHDFIFKIANLVFVLWLVISLVLFWVKLTDIILPDREMTYEIYELQYCDYPYYKESMDEEAISEDEYMSNCLDNYEREIYYQDMYKENDLKQLFILLGNILIVGSVIYFLNRRKV